jgi:DNA-binding NarL/FixJ family response regulator
MLSGKPLLCSKKNRLTFSGNLWDGVSNNQGEEPMGIRIIIADSYLIFRQGLKALLEKEPDMEVVGEASDGLETVALVRELTPNVVIMDVNLPILNGIEASRQILSEYEGIKVIAFSMHADRRYVINMLKAGVQGYLLKDCAFEELSQAIRLVMFNKPYLSPGATEVVIKDYLEKPSTKQTAFSLLTDRERQVLQIVAEGKSTKQVAEVLNLSVKTVETHRQQIMHKLGTRSIAELTKYAIREGIITLEQ